MMDSDAAKTFAVMLGAALIIALPLLTYDGRDSAFNACARGQSPEVKVDCAAAIYGTP